MNAHNVTVTGSYVLSSASFKVNKLSHSPIRALLPLSGESGLQYMLRLFSKGPRKVYCVTLRLHQILALIMDSAKANAPSSRATSHMTLLTFHSFPPFHEGDPGELVAEALGLVSYSIQCLKSFG